MPRRFFIFLWGILAIFVCNSCDKSPMEQTKKAKGILPLSIRNSWTFHSTDGIIQTTYRITGKQKLSNGIDVFIFDKEFIFKKNAFYESNGALFGLNMSNPDSTLAFIFPDGVKVGDQWKILNNEALLKVEAVDDKVITPAGTFTCVRTVDLAISNKSYVWWAYGVGVVKVGTYNKFQQLFSYQFK